MDTLLGEEELDYDHEDIQDDVDDSCETHVGDILSEEVSADKKQFALYDVSFISDNQNDSSPEDFGSSGGSRYKTTASQEDDHIMCIDVPSSPEDSGLGSGKSVSPERSPCSSVTLAEHSRASTTPSPLIPPVLSIPDVSPLLSAKCEKKICWKAYGNDPFDSCSTVNNVKPGKAGLMHRHLHMCHTGSETELGKIIGKLLTNGLDYQQAVIFVRRDERIMDLKKILERLHLLVYVMKSAPEKAEMLRIFDNFGERRRKILLCSARILPPMKALMGCDLIIWWNLPWTEKDFRTIHERLTCRALLLVVLKQEDDWMFLSNQKRNGTIFPEMDLDSDETKSDGFLASPIKLD